MSRGSKKEAPVDRSSAAVDKPDAAVSCPLKPERGLPAAANQNWLVPGICVFLVAIVWVVFGQTVHDQFVNFDDNQYIYENPAIAYGLTAQGVKYAFTRIVVANWHPLTMLSYLLDNQWYGLNPGGYHLTNVILHAATAILLFLMLRQMTQFLWRSAFVAAVFAVHPLRVESVAWISERKDVLSGLFFMLTLWAYVRYVRQGTGENSIQSQACQAEASERRRGTGHRSRYYYLAVFCFALGLMSKPMLVSVPLVLLLLDYWPLGRVGSGRWRMTHQLLFEKWPFVGLAMAWCVITVFTQINAIQTFENLPLSLRLANALTSYVVYLGQMFWPSHSAAFYPIPTTGIGILEATMSLVLLVGITVGAFILCRLCPWILTGWLWYLIMLMPVIGILQVGTQAHADRYTYLPEIGLYLTVTWTAAELCAGWRRRRLVLGGLTTVILVALILCARTQTMYWRNSETLWTHALTCTSNNAVAHFNLGKVLFQKGQTDEAIAQYQQALEIKPDYAAAHGNIGNALIQKGQVDEAIAQYQQALQIDPDYEEVYNNLGNALLSKGRAGEAISQYQKALQLKPDAVDVLNNLAWLLATSPDAHIRNGVQAVRYASRACELTHNDVPIIIGALAAAYAEAGHFPQAVTTAQRAVQLAETQSNPALADALRSQMNLYQAGIAFRQ